MTDLLDEFPSLVYAGEGDSPILFTVPGTPQQQGSKRSLGKFSIEDNVNLKPWRAEAISAAKAAFDGQIFEPVAVWAVFGFPRLKGHYGSGKKAAVLKETAPTYKASTPDLDKLQRALGDALTQSGVLRDDSLISVWITTKTYVASPQTSVMIRKIQP